MTCKKQVCGSEFLLSTAFGFDAHSKVLNATCATYEREYGIVFDITEEEYLSKSEAELQAYNDAYAALLAEDF